MSNELQIVIDPQVVNDVSAFMQNNWPSIIKRWSLIQSEDENGNPRYVFTMEMAKAVPVPARCFYVDDEPADREPIETIWGDVRLTPTEATDG